MLKRSFDIIIGAAALILLSPLMVMVAVLVWLTLGRPVLFRQQRPGLNGKPFQLIKFRTMRSGSDSDAERLTPFGKALRACSLDELPELWNVLKGDMSLVGPRPLLMEYLPLYTSEQARRHEVRPGITGWAQIGGRNALSWDEKFARDIWYVDNRTFRLDVSILGRTLISLLRREGITADNEATMPKFRGNRRLKVLAIVGASGHGKVVAEAALLAGWQSVAFFDDRWPNLSLVGPWHVQGDLNVYKKAQQDFDGACVAIGDNANRLRIHRELHVLGSRLVNVIHPSAVVSQYARIGSGTVVLANAVVNPFSQIGCSCIINTAASVEHDCIISDAVHISPGARLGGNVQVGEAAWVGIGASVKHGSRIGAGAVVGAGAAVVKNVLPGATVVGVPAAPVK